MKSNICSKLLKSERCLKISRYIFVFFIIFLSQFLSLRAQIRNIHKTQINSVPGIYSGIQIKAGHQQLWLEWAERPRYSDIMISARIGNSSGIAMSINNSKWGAVLYNKIDFTYAKHFLLIKKRGGKLKLALALSPTLSLLYFDKTKIKLREEADPVLNNIFPEKIISFSPAFSLYSNKYNFFFSYPLSKVKDNYSEKFRLSVSANFDINRKIKIYTFCQNSVFNDKSAELNLISLIYGKNKNNYWWAGGGGLVYKLPKEKNNYTCKIIVGYSFNGKINIQYEAGYNQNLYSNFLNNYHKLGLTYIISNKKYLCPAYF